MSDEAAGAGGVPPGIAAIMAAIRHEVTASPARAVPADDGDPGPPRFAPRADADGPLPVPPAARAGTAAVPLPVGLDAEVRTLLAPLLKEWLDAHLPEIVEVAIRSEIRRLTGFND